MNIAVIPARGGSKRIKRKNIRVFSKKPMIYYAINLALKSNLFKEVIVSTDDQEIAEISKKFGANVPFVRSKNLSDDFTPTIPVINDAIQNCKNIGYEFENVCCIYPSVPFVKIEDMLETFKLFKKNQKKFCFPITEFHSSIFRSFHLNKDKSLKLLFPENEFKRTQDLDTIYHDCGLFYWGTVTTWLEGKGLHSNGVGYQIPNWRVIDFDTKDDWKRAELLIKILK